MALTYDQLQEWKPEGLDTAADDLNTARKKLLDQQDEMDAGKIPDTWIGESATRAENRHRALVAGLNDIAAPLGQVITELDEAGAVIKKAKSSAKGAHDAARAKGWVVSASSPITISAGKTETEDGDEATMKELAQTIQDAITDAENAATALTSVLNNATKGTYDGGTGSIEQATLPPELRGLSDDELTKKLLADPDLMDDTWEVLPPEVQAAIGDYTAKKLEDLDDINSVADRKEAEKWFSILGKHSDDRDFGEAVIDQLGPEGLNNVIHKMTGWTSTQITYPDYENPPVMIGDETTALEKLQREGAGNLAALLGSASRGGWIDNADYAEAIGQDSTAAAILLHSAEERKVELGGDFTHKLGTKLLEIENGDPLRYSQITNGLFFGGESYMDENGDPVRQFVKVADNGIDSAQAVMSDENMAKYLMHDRLTAAQLANDMDSVVRAATVDAAMEPGDAGRKAAEIASWTVKYAAGTELDDAYDEELGGIVGTYIADTFAAADDGSYPPIDPPVPPHHATFNKSDLETVLNQVGGNETATSIIGQQSAKLNQLVIDEYTQQSLEGRASGDVDWHADTDGDPLKIGFNRTAGVRGFIEDELAQGMIDDGEKVEVARRKTAELFTLPLDLIPTDKTGPLGGYLIGEVKDQIIDGYVGDPVRAAATEGTANFESARRATEIQALYSVATAETDAPPGDLPPELVRDRDGTVRFDTGVLRDWPRDADGAPKPPGALTEKEVANILSTHQHTPGINAVTTNGVKEAWDNLQGPKSGQGK